MHLKKMQINFCVRKKFRFTSKEDANQFLCQKKSKFASKEDTNLFFFFEKRLLNEKIFEIQKKNHNNKTIKKMFSRKNLTTHGINIRN